MGPYEVVKVFENGVVGIKNIDEWNFVFLVNGHRFMLYFHPLTKGYFMQQVRQPFENELIGGNTNLAKI